MSVARTRASRAIRSSKASATRAKELEVTDSMGFVGLLIDVVAGLLQVLRSACCWLRCSTQALQAAATSPAIDLKLRLASCSSWSLRCAGIRARTSTV